MPEVNPYRHFFALPPKPWCATQHPCYLFIWDAEGQLACGEGGSQDLLARLPKFAPNSRANCLASSFGFRLFGFVSSKDKVEIPEPYVEQALCLMGAKEQCGSELLAQLGPFRWQSFRSLLLFCPEWQAGLLARAKELAYFPREFRFCSSCGGSLEWLEGEFGRACRQCRALFFPRQDPSVIVLVCQRATDGREWLLLAHNYRFRPQLYSLIAGFVEAGETLEQAVVREVWEEAGVRLAVLRYLRSQAWPEKHSLMAGFSAYSENGMTQCRPDGREIAALLWLERQDILDCLQRGSALPLAQCRQDYVFQSCISCEAAFCLPQRGSIARRLIEQWAYFPEFFRGGHE